MASRDRGAEHGGTRPLGNRTVASSWLNEAALPTQSIGPGIALYRIHGRARDPLFFGPGPGNSPAHRFNSASGRFGVLYVGLGMEGAVAETLLRNPQRRIVSTIDLEARALSELSCRRELRVARLYGSGLQQVGTDNRVSTRPYDPCGLWSDALWDHPDQPDGIAYQSRHDPDEICLAVFERAGLKFHVHPAVPLIGPLLSRIAAMLDRYGKSVSPE